MPRPAYFRTVITRVIEREVPDIAAAPAELADKIIEALDLVESLMGPDAPPPAPSKPSNILTKTQYPSIDLSKGVPIGEIRSNQLDAEIVEEAPPVAVVRNPDGQVTAETDEEIETKKSQLHAWILANLPRSMTLRLPGFDADIQLNQYVRVSPVKMNFIRVFYTQFVEQEDGPQVQLSTADKTLDAAQIKSDIIQQAESRYRKEKKRIEPRIPPPNPVPDIEAMMRSAKYDPSQDVVSKEDREQWNQTAGKQVI